ncbi:MAG: signal recognition particle-docking protein FtsY [Faecalicoccus sp.]|nr:signal recognition particle-docking protein FtsY [Faecalicoccus sp.]
MGVFDSIKDAFTRSKDKDKYLNGLNKSRKTFGDRLRNISNTFNGVSDKLLEEVMILLLESDMGVDTAEKIVKTFEQKAGDYVYFNSIEEYLVSIMHDFYCQKEDPEINYNPDGPTVIFMVGVNGSGKTTTSAKLIQYYQQMDKKVAVAAADTFRAGAVDQIAVWAERLNAPCIKGKPNQDPASVLVDACRYAKDNDIDILICDTAGRLQNKKNLMNELTKMHRVVDREIPGAPHETWLVLDATTGQNGIIQAEVFLEATDVTGIILTKMDGTAKGGVVMTIRDKLKLPVRFLGLGEKPDDLRPFDINSYLMGITNGFRNE